MWRGFFFFWGGGVIDLSYPPIFNFSFEKLQNNLWGEFFSRGGFSWGGGGTLPLNYYKPSQNI